MPRQHWKTFLQAAKKDKIYNYGVKFKNLIGQLHNLSGLYFKCHARYAIKLLEIKHYYVLIKINIITIL